MWPFEREKPVIDHGIHVYPHSLIEDGTFYPADGKIFISQGDYERTKLDPQHLFSLRMIGRAATPSSR